MDFKAIKDFEAGNRIESFFIIKSALCKVSSTNKKYLDFTLGDKTGEINAKLWECTEEDEKNFRDNKIVKVKGTVIAWQNMLQLKVDKIRFPMEEDKVKIEDFVPSAPYPAEEMYELLNCYIEEINNNDIKNIVKSIIEENKDKLMNFPAAMKNHHSVRSGLLYHVTTMLRAGEKLCDVYTYLNKDLLYAGIMLHDIAKLQEMNASDLGIVSEYTIEGQLLGHIILGVEKIAMAGEKVKADKEIVMLLKHMVLSHHYEPEYGSPKKPMIPEAEMLHYLDDMDAKMFDMQKALRDTAGGSLSDSIWSLEKRKIYKPKVEM
ncbi:MAG: OB-fold nucleic acid binding domain-containing protein [Bacillota bacterium]|nr:OB-fold nucleic acid binding domain-containing protein [Bacillota bacterium]